ncbi:hypothetical protein HBI45_196640 [Parastagonospora nodorum]|nr:hypothetical protein HBI45_196640 [Parastagonospora nodorum]
MSITTLLKATLYLLILKQLIANIYSAKVLCTKGDKIMPSPIIFKDKLRNIKASFKLDNKGDEQDDNKEENIIIIENSTIKEYATLFNKNLQASNKAFFYKLITNIC